MCQSIQSLSCYYEDTMAQSKLSFAYVVRLETPYTMPGRQ